MGITTDEFFENIYSVIFSPKAFFEKKDRTISIRLAAATVAFIAVINKLIASVFGTSTTNIFLLIFFLILQVAAMLVLWFLTALFFEYTAKIFDKSGNFHKVLFYTSFAPIPYIFFAPLNLLKQFSNSGYFIGSIAELILYFWIIFLYALSIRAAYDISISRSFMLIFLPFVSSFFAIYWLVCFFIKIEAIFSI